MIRNYSEHAKTVNRKVYLGFYRSNKIIFFSKDLYLNININIYTRAVLYRTIMPNYVCGAILYVSVQ